VRANIQRTAAAHDAIRRIDRAALEQLAAGADLATAYRRAFDSASLTRRPTTALQPELDLFEQPTTHAQAAG